MTRRSSRAGGSSNGSGSNGLRVSTLSDDERNALVEWNDTAAPFNPDVCVHELIATCAARYPGRDAVLFEGSSITYGDLDRRANAVAHSLATNGARTGTVVGFHAERSIETIVGLVGIMKTGAAAVALDPSYPKERLMFMLGDSGATIVLSGDPVASSSLFKGSGIATVALGGASESVDDPPPTTVSASDPMNVIYTSGSTGRPKGVSVRHLSVVNLLTCAAGYFPLGPHDTVGAVSTFAFDISVIDFWLPLTSGARVCVVPHHTVTDPRRLGQLIADTPIRLMHATPSLWQTLIDARWAGSSDLVSISAGEPLPPSLARELRDRCRSLWNAYGPTETTVWATIEKVEDEDPVSIGRPLANTRVYILDEHLDSVPVGSSGEIVIGGVGVSEGYINRPEETARRYVEDRIEGSGLFYRTGDLARFLPDGRIQHLGRIDDQIQYHGFRIEPAEIEATLRVHPRVRSAVVVRREDVPGRPILVAYIVSKGSRPAETELRQLLRKTLPNYMVPGAFVYLDHLPYTASGKLNRLSLPAPDPTQRLEGSRSPPASETEVRLLETWKTVLGVDELGVEDDFFESGGDSLLAWEIVVAAGDSLGTELPVDVLLENGATVRGMACAIDALRYPSHGRVGHSNSRRTLFCIVPTEGTLIALRHIEKELQDQCEVVGLLCGRLGQRFDPSLSMEDLADDALRRIRECQAPGPYLLAGHSVGGLVAYVAAGKLLAEGEEVAWIGLLDTCEPYAFAKQQRWRAKFDRHREHFGRDALRKLRHTLKYRHLQHPIGRLPANWFDEAGAEAAVVRHRVSGHNAPMDLFLSEISSSVFGPTGGWGQVHQGELVVHHLPGRHTAPLEERHAEAVAKAAMKRLVRLQ
jgi:amino acid adenylation domain-containing protein